MNKYSLPITSFVYPLIKDILKVKISKMLSWATHVSATSVLLKLLAEYLLKYLKQSMPMTMLSLFKSETADDWDILVDVSWSNACESKRQSKLQRYKSLVKIFSESWILFTKSSPTRTISKKIRYCSLNFPGFKLAPIDIFSNRHF